MKSRIEIKRICAWCGKEFIAYKTTTNCCSHKCGNALYKKRKRDAAMGHRTKRFFQWSGKMGERF